MTTLNSQVQANTTARPIEVGQIAPEIALQDVNGKIVTLSSLKGKYVLVDFWAVWCGPCRMVGPIVEELSKDYEGKAVVSKVDVDSNPNISMKFGIRNIPTLLVFKNGQVVDKQVGAVPKTVLAGKLDAQIN